jgi:hypothetical protein
MLATMSDVPPNVTMTVNNNPGELRYEIHADDELAGFVTYVRHGDVVEFMHAEVFPKWEGHGIGSELAQEALDDLVEAGHTITPSCPFIADFVIRHPSYLPHVDEASRQQLEARIATEVDDEAGA